MVWDELAIADHRDRFYPEPLRPAVPPTCTICCKAPSLPRFNSISSDADGTPDFWCQSCADENGVKATAHYRVWKNGKYWGLFYWEVDTTKAVIAELKRQNPELGVEWQVSFAFYAEED